MKLTRVFVPTALGAVLVLTSACTSGGNDAEAAGCVAAGDASNAISVEGDISSDISLTNDVPVTAETLERTVMTEGEGDMIEAGQGIVVTTAFFNGDSGDLLSAGTAQGLVYTEDLQKSVLKQLKESPEEEDSSGSSLQPWAANVIACGVSGERVTTVGNAEDTFGQTAEGMGLTDIGEDDAIVTVSDVLGVVDLLDAAEGTEEKVSKDLPAVSTQKDGSPKITIPKGEDAPSDLEVATLVTGDGEKVEPGDVVFVNYHGVIWGTGEEFDSSWTSGSPVAFSTTGVIEGFTQALEGQTVGSQVISVVPPEQGYGDSLESMGYEKDDVMVFVLDILGTVHTS